MVQIPTLTKCHAYSQHRSTTLSAIPLSLEMQALPASVEYIDSPNAPAPIPVVAPADCGKGMGKSLLMAVIQLGLVGAICPYRLQSLFSTILIQSRWK